MRNESSLTLPHNAYSQLRDMKKKKKKYINKNKYHCVCECVRNMKTTSLYKEAIAELGEVTESADNERCVQKRALLFIILALLNN